MFDDLHEIICKYVDDDVQALRLHDEIKKFLDKALKGEKDKGIGSSAKTIAIVSNPDVPVAINPHDLDSGKHVDTEPLSIKKRD